MPKHYVIKNDRLEEVRGYKDEVVVERWGIVYNEDDIPVGLKPLPIEEVIPESILDKIKFWRKPKPLTQILSIDFIGLIQYIGLINKINKIKNIELIDEITTIKNIEHATVDTLTTIRDVIWSPRTLIQDPSFEQDGTGWFGSIPGIEIDSKVYHVHGKSLKIPAREEPPSDWIAQKFPIPIGVSWLTEFYVWYRSSGITAGHGVIIEYYYTDGTSSSETLTPSAINTWEKHTLNPTADKYIERIFILSSAGASTFDHWLDDFITVLANPL